MRILLVRIKTFFLSLIAIAIPTGLVVADFYTRHEIQAKSVRQLEALGLTADANGLCLSVEQGNLEVLPIFDAAEVDFAKANSLGDTPLISAVKMGAFQMVDEILSGRQARNSIDTVDSTGQSVVSLALKAKNYELTEKLLDEYDASFDWLSDEGEPYLNCAIRQSDAGLINFLLGRKEIDVNGVSEEGTSPVEIAYRLENLELFKRLISEGADLREIKIDGKPLVFDATEAERYDELEICLARDCSPNAAGNGKYALDLALEKNDGFMTRLLLDRGADPGLLQREKPLFFEFFDRDQHDLIDLFLGFGESIEGVNKQGENLLMVAARNDDFRMLDYLIEKGAKLTVRRPDGMGLIDQQLASGNTAMLQFLIDKGMDATDPKHLWTAYENRDLPSFEILLDSGASPNKTSGDGVTLLEKAVADDLQFFAEKLLIHGADPKDLLWTSVVENKPNFIELLLRAGADPNRQDAEGLTPLGYCIQKEELGNAGLLLRGGADPNIPFDAEENWLPYSIRTGNEGVALTLLNASADLGEERCGDGHSMLAWSIAHSMHKVSMGLVERGADPNIIERYPAKSALIKHFSFHSSLKRHMERDKRVRPMMMCAATRNYDLAKAMVAAGAENHYTSKYMRPISVAAKIDDVRMMQIIYKRDPDVQERKIVIDLSQQRVTLYENDKKTYSSRCSTGETWLQNSNRYLCDHREGQGSRLQHLRFSDALFYETELQGIRSSYRKMPGLSGLSRVHPSTLICGKTPLFQVFPRRYGRYSALIFNFFKNFPHNSNLISFRNRKIPNKHDSQIQRPALCSPILKQSFQSTTRPRNFFKNNG